MRRAVTEAPGQAADRFAGLVRDAPPSRLDRLMRSRARRLVLDAVFRQMPRHLDRTRAVGVRSTVRWHVTGRPDGQVDVYELRIEQGRSRVSRRLSEGEPRVAISVDGAEFLRIVTGNSDPMQAYFTGRLAVSGDLMHAAKLTALFRMPQRTSRGVDRESAA
jgi:predicted lipid carrier protein YhbT